MRKKEFLNQLRANLSGLPESELEERLGFYSEIIDDRIEEGLMEEDAVSEIGSPDKIAEQIISEIPLLKLAKDRIKLRRRITALETVLLVIGSPIWLSLAIAAFAVILSLYVTLWSFIVALWAVFASFAACGIGGVIAGIIFAISGKALTGIAMIGAAFVCAGIAILLFYGSKGSTDCIVRLTAKIALGVKKCFIRKGNE